MNWNEYLNYTHEIVNADVPPAPYDHPDYYHYTKMNEARMKRWIKTNPITPEAASLIKSIDQPQQWVVITEPWCGDAAHIVPIIYLMSTWNDKISFTLQLRDSASEIDHYLTSGSKSIPILIVRDENGKDLFHWGPRPKKGQEMYLELAARKADFEEIKTAIQNYYNADKSLSTQKEIIALLSKVNA
ncbi:thioredoxin family protein [Niabella aquatica]